MKHKKRFIVGVSWLVLSIVWFIFTIVTPIIVPSYKSIVFSSLHQLGFFAFLFGSASSIGITFGLILAIIGLDGL
jgi:hypothetical protein